LLGEAKKYVIEIYKAFDKAGYTCQHFLLNASKIGVPQRRERVFFICLRKDLAPKFMESVDMFTELPKIELNFNEKEIVYSEIETKERGKEITLKKIQNVFYEINPGEGCGNFFSRTIGKQTYFNYNKAHPKQVIPTIIANNNCGTFHYSEPFFLSDKELKLAGSYPLDYDFLKLKPKYLIGMSVPPLMTGKIAEQIYKQWLNKLKWKQ